MPLYPKNNTQNLNCELFKNPTSEYRGTPFWAWNCKLDKGLLLRQIEYLKEMGLGGFHIHSRTGLDTEYLSDEFMDMVKACNEKAKEEDMLCWLYDEDRWPSGSAGGIVTKNISYRSKCLVFTYNKKTDGKFLAAYSVKLVDGFLEEYKRLNDVEDNGINGGEIWYAYMLTEPESSWYNNQAYVDTLNPEAINEFIKVTHERYYEVLGEDFGKSIPAIFTDEPKFYHKTTLKFAADKNEICFSYTDDFDKSYKEAYGEDLLDVLPEIVWQLPGNVSSSVRYRYHDHACERFTTAFADNIGKWCGEHGIQLTGHALEEYSLGSQTNVVGEAMRCYRGFQLPGIDILRDYREFTTAKQAQSATRQFGRDGVLSELYGVTNWDFDFKGHKLQGDWQAAMGVTVRVHHLTWLSMEGDAKRDYPACIGYQSPWYKEYKLIEDHFARVNTVMTRGKPVVRIGVIHPIESYWLHFGPWEHTRRIREQLEKNFTNIIEWLQFGLLDFDLISESLLPDLCKSVDSAVLNVGEMNYDVIVIPGVDMLRGTTLDRLEAFCENGGQVIFMSNAPRYVDGKLCDRAKILFDKCQKIGFVKHELYDALSDNRDIEIITKSQIPDGNLFYQMRQDGDDRFLFISHVYKGDEYYKKNMRFSYVESEETETIDVKIKGCWDIKQYDTMTGNVSDIEYEIKDGYTYFNRTVYHWDSLLLRLSPSKLENKRNELNVPLAKEKVYVNIPNPVKVTLSEPNVLLLDIAEYRIDCGEWRSSEELLKICAVAKRELGFAHDSTQPWAVVGGEKYEHRLDLRFAIYSEINISGAAIAIERPERAVIYVNGTKIENNVTGYYVDESIKTIPIPELKTGVNEIIVEMAFGRKSNVEWCYILGDFGVRVSGSRAVVTEPVRELFFGDQTTQGLPFYGGNVIYDIPINTKSGCLNIKVPKFKNPVIGVAVDGVKQQSIAIPPYTVSCGEITDGEHTIQLTSYGSRINTFGQVHLYNETLDWFGPESWYSWGDAFAYEYNLKKTGILTAPKIWVETY
jgi:hypothetical protein